MAKHNVYRDGEVHVLAEKCRTCIFGPNRPVSAGRVRGMVEQTQAEDGGNIPCHSTLFEPGVDNAICRGWWDRYADQDVLMRLAQAMEIVVEDPVPAGH